MTTIPCKRPRVTTEPSATAVGLYDHVCHVPGCGWKFTTVKSAMEAKWHRDAHRRLVPKAWVEHGVEYDVHCEPCGGHRRTFGTRVDAQAWLDYHLSTEHGLVKSS